MKALTLLGRAVAMTVLVLVAGCASQGPAKAIPVSMPGGERMTIVAHNQSMPDWLMDRSKLKLNYLVKGDVSQRQLEAITETERACRLYTDTVRPSNLVAVLTQGALYAIAGGIGDIGSGFLTGATRAYQGEMAGYGASASGFSGTANGLVTLAGQTYTFENCGREVLNLFPSYDVKVLSRSPY